MNKTIKFIVALSGLFISLGIYFFGLGSFLKAMGRSNADKGNGVNKEMNLNSLNKPSFYS